MRCGDRTTWSSAPDFDEDTVEDADEPDFVRPRVFMSPSPPRLAGFRVGERLRPGGMDDMLANPVNLE